jgi:5'-nucleotidase / UDP-sugar diphosphatase
MNRPTFRLAVILAVLLAAAAAGPAREVPIRIVHTTDLHGHILPTRDYDGRDQVGGLLRGATEIRRLRAEQTNSLLVDDGDLFQGSIESLQTGGRIMPRALAALGYDAWIVGNHEFDWGLPKLKKVHDAAVTPILAANIAGLDGQPIVLDKIKPYLVREFDGVKIAVVGLTTPGIPSWSLPDQLGNLVFQPSVDALARVMPAVRAEKPAIVVLVAHQGYRDFGDDFANQIQAIHGAFPEFCVIIGGHSHKAVEQTMLGDTLYTQAGYFGIFIGCVDLVYDTVEGKVVRRKAQLVPVDEKVPFDAAFEKEFADDLAKARARAAEPAGEAADEIDAALDATGHSPSQQLIARAISEATGADAVLHGALTTEKLAPGPLTVGDVWRIVPYENRVGVLQLTPADLEVVLAENATRRNTTQYMSGFGLSWTETTNAEGRIVIENLRGPDGKPIHPRHRLKVAFNSYVLASGGQRFPKLRDLARQPETRAEIRDLDTRTALLDYLRRHRPLRRADLMAGR